MQPAQAPAVLYHHERLNALECMGCGEMIEIPRTALLRVDKMVQRVTIHDNPEHRMLWMEMHRIDHADCMRFEDEEKAKDHRENRRAPVVVRKAGQR